MTWYGVRSVVEHPASGGRLHEERVVLVEAPDEEAAFALAAAESDEYCAALADATDAGLQQLCVIGDEPVASGTEVHSLMRTHRLDARRYVDRFFATGAELERNASDDPA